MREKIIISILTFFIIINAYCANNSIGTQRDTIGTFSLGEITCIGYRPVEGVNSFTANQIQRHDVHTIEDALNLMPSLTVRDAGSRGEGIFYLRGFDQKRVPVLLDGVPIYIPFESTLDIRRLSTSNLSKITIEKGAPSILAGINAMGGTVNLVSSKPIEKFELDASVSTLYDANLSIGSAHKLWYAQTSISYDKRDFIRLPHSFKYIEGVQESRHLVNSDRKDMTVNARVGLTLADDEYAVGYTMIRANKGVPVYLGQNGKRRFWRYDPWDKDEILLHTRTVTGSAGTFETRVYYDRYYNVVRSYDDINCTIQESKNAFNSIYDDYSLGATLNWQRQLHNVNTLKIGANYKRDVHRSHNEGEPVSHKSDNIYSVAIEDLWSPSNALHFTFGAGLFGINGDRAEDYEKPDGSTNLQMVSKPLAHDMQFNYQLTTTWNLTSTDRLKLSMARTSRFPTLSERYTYKFGKSIPNPHLKSEHSFNLDLTAEGNNRGLSWYVSGYCSWLGDVIQDITGVDPENPTVFQPQNSGCARFIGWEAALSYRFFKALELKANYSFVHRVNTTNRSLLFTDVPKHKGLISADCTLPLSFNINADWILYSRASSTSDGSLWVPGFGVINVRANKSFLDRHLIVEGGIRNVFDKLYYYTEGYPQEGRVFYAAIRYDFRIR